MKIPIASQTMEEIRVSNVALLDRYPELMPSVVQHIAFLTDEIARLRQLEDQACKTAWHDSLPEGLPDRLELEELNQMMRSRNG